IRLTLAGGHPRLRDGLGGTIFETRGRNPRTGVRGSGGEMMEMMEMKEKVSGAAEGGKKMAGAVLV
ncbi:MAG: hypothetical protein N2039_06240, partial [Gemmataceae bacterium]|nr:hypothetical protein [Gemmataceae bacterium]